MKDMETWKYTKNIGKKLRIKRNKKPHNADER